MTMRVTARMAEKDAKRIAASIVSELQKRARCGGAAPALDTARPPWSGLGKQIDGELRRWFLSNVISSGFRTIICIQMNVELNALSP
jgi:hypothetical protein